MGFLWFLVDLKYNYLSCSWLVFLPILLNAKLLFALGLMKFTLPSSTDKFFPEVVSLIYILIVSSCTIEFYSSWLLACEGNFEKRLFLKYETKFDAYRLLMLSFSCLQGSKLFSVSCYFWVMVYWSHSSYSKTFS